MKKIALLLAIMMFLSSCSLGEIKLGGKDSFFQDDRANANNCFEKVLDAIRNKDKGALKSLFSKKALAESENFDAVADDLFCYFQGDFVSYDDWGWSCWR